MADCLVSYFLERPAVARTQWNPRLLGHVTVLQTYYITGARGRQRSWRDFEEQVWD